MVIFSVWALWKLNIDNYYSSIDFSIIIMHLFFGKPYIPLLIEGIANESNVKSLKNFSKLGYNIELPSRHNNMQVMILRSNS